MPAAHPSSTARVLQQLMGRHLYEVLSSEYACQGVFWYIWVPGCSAASTLVAPSLGIVVIQCGSSMLDSPPTLRDRKPGGAFRVVEWPVEACGS